MSDISGREPRINKPEPGLTGDEPMLGGDRRQPNPGPYDLIWPSEDKRQTDYCTIRIGDDVWPLLIREDIPAGFSGMYIGPEGIIIYDKGRPIARSV